MVSFGSIPEIWRNSPTRILVPTCEFPKGLFYAIRGFEVYLRREGAKQGIGENGLYLWSL